MKILVWTTFDSVGNVSVPVLVRCFLYDCTHVSETAHYFRFASFFPVIKGY